MKFRKPMGKEKLKAKNIITWRELNERLRQIENEKEAEELWREICSMPRATLKWKSRVYSRYSRLRRRREHREMRKKRLVTK